MTKKQKSNHAINSSLKDYTPPRLEKLERVLKPLIRYFDPQYHNFHRHNAKNPTLFVANHSLLSIADMLLPYGIYKETDDYVRVLGDKLHFSSGAPHRSIFLKAGVVLGTRDNVRELMDDRQSILVFPGGIREVLKRRGEKYSLQWKNRTGFIQLALEKGYTITPIGVAGGDDMFNILMDGNDVGKLPLGRRAMESKLGQKWLRGGDVLPPVLRGVGLSMFPKPQQLHFNCGAAIDLSAHHDAVDDKMKMIELRGIVSSEIYSLVDEARDFKSKARANLSLARRILS